MNNEAEMLEGTQPLTAAPSADFIQAISQFLDTDPSDLLAELGYYMRDDNGSNSAQ